jgi:hypothetical protein
LKELNESISKSVSHDDRAFQAYEDRLSNSAKKIGDSIKSRSKSGQKARSHKKTNSSGSREYVALRNNNMSRDFTMGELDRITTLNSIKEKPRTTKAKIRSTSAHNQPKLSKVASKKKVSNKSFTGSERKQRAGSGKPLSTKNKVASTNKNFAFSPKQGGPSLERKRKNDPTQYASIKSDRSPINLTNQQAYPLNESSTKTNTYAAGDQRAVPNQRAAREADVRREESATQKAKKKLKNLQAKKSN